MDKKGTKFDLCRPYKLTHQLLCITSINFQRKALMGYVELMLHPQGDLKTVRVNCKQLRIHKVCVNSYEASFQYQDPSLDLTQRDAKSRNLEFLSACHLSAVESVDPDIGCHGEVTICLPSEVHKAVKDKKPICVSIDFTLENPKGGIQFVVPKNNGDVSDCAAHLFTYGHENTSRLWFPCIDTFSEPCTWKLEFTVDESMTAVSCGDLMETVLTPDRQRKTFHYILSIPTAAPNICLAVGNFQILVDPHMHEVTHFCLPELMPLLEHTTSTCHEIIEFYEEILGFRLPYSCYKQVFIDEAYQDVQPFASVGIFSTNLLFSKIILDQTPMTRKHMARALAEQFFGCFMARESWNDYWVPVGISGYLYGLWLRSTFGNSEYRQWVSAEIDQLCEYETNCGPVVLHCDSKEKSLSRHFPHQHPHTMSIQHYNILRCKAHVVMRQIENRIGPQLLLKAFNKLLSLASSSAQQKVLTSSWTTMLLSTSGFLKSTYAVSGEDINNLIDQWVKRSGVVSFRSSFLFNRKRNVVELDIKQDVSSEGTQKYVGPLTVRVQELDGTYNHTIQIEDNTTKHDIICHSKSRRNKRKKIPLLNGEEADIDLNAMDPESPVLWVRIDPDVTMARIVEHEQPDYMWQYQVRYERDVVGQSEAIKALEHLPSQATRLALEDIIENKLFYYKVRAQACMCLSKVANALMNTWAGPPAMINLFTRFFCCETSPPIVKLNNFCDLQQYFMQKSMPIAMSLLRNAHGMCPKEVVQFLLDLVKYNDNSRNKYSDNYYRSSLVASLSNTVSPAVAVSTEQGFTSESLTSDIRVIVDELTRFLNLEKHLPSYRYTITVSCLQAIRILQRNGHLPVDAKLFKSYAVYGFFHDVRLAAVECLVDLIKSNSCVEELLWLVDLAFNDLVPEIKLAILNALVRNPPFEQDAKSPLNNIELVENLWNFINIESFYDPRLRCEAVDLYFKLFGKKRPHCLPAPQLGVVVNLKEKKTQINPTIKPEKRPYDDLDQSATIKLKHSASVPVVASQSDEAAKNLKMKIKFAATSRSHSALNTDDVLAAQSLLSLSHVDPSSCPSTPGVSHQHLTPSWQSAVVNVPGDETACTATNPEMQQHVQLPQPLMMGKEKKKKHKRHKHKHRHRADGEWSSPATPASSVHSPFTSGHSPNEF